MKDFFVSYNRHDRAFAEWIAWILEEAEYSVVIQAWDFRPGGNFVLDMQKAASEAERTIAVLSDHYLESLFTQPEWAAAFAQDPTGEKRTLIPIRVGECKLSGILATIVYVDLVGIDEAEAQELVQRSVRDGRTKPNQKPRFPGSAASGTNRTKPVYPPDIAANLPRVSEIFVGRDEDLEALHKQLQSRETIAISSITGMGGIGKTELAAQYALQQRDMGTYPGGICWLRAREDVGSQIVLFARSQLNLTIPEDLELAEKVAWCWRNWEKKETLIVLDNVQQYDDIASVLPPQRSQFRVLLTTRSRFGRSVQNFEIQVLSEERSLELLRAIVQDQRVDQDLATAKQVCEWLGYLPLGLELVGRYLAKKKNVSVVKLWQRLQDKKLEAKALLEREQGMTALLGVTAAFELSWQELNEDAQKLAALLSLFALAEIPWALVQGCLPEVDEEELEDLLDEKLVGLSLLSRTQAEMYELHQLLREFFAVKREQMTETEEWKRSFCKVMVREGQKIPQQPTLSILQAVLPTIPHLKEAATTLNPWLSDDDLIVPATRIAWFHQGQSAFAEAEQWYGQCRAIVEQRLGEQHPDVAASLNNLAGLYYAQGRYEEAEPLYLQALALCRSLLGEQHPDVATSLNNLAALYRAQGRYEEAEPFYLQALALCRSLLGEQHPDVASSLNNLAELYRAQGRYEAAEPLYLQALQLWRSLLGESHPYVATSLNNLAVLYANQGRLTDAEPLFVQALERYQQLLGHQHPHTVMTRQSLEYLRQMMGKPHDEG